MKCHSHDSPFQSRATAAKLPFTHTTDRLIQSNPHKPQALARHAHITSPITATTPPQNPSRPFTIPSSPQ